MSGRQLIKVSWHFWFVAALAFIWNALGCVNYLMQMNPEMVAGSPATHLAIINGRPGWATGGFAVSVFLGAIGGLLLLLRRSAAVYAFAASLLGTLLTMVHTIDVARNVIAFSNLDIFIMIILPILVEAYFLWYAKRAISKGWIA